MRSRIAAFVALTLTLCFPACVSQPVPYGPGLDFECRLSYWISFAPPLELLLQRDFLKRTTITRFNYQLDGDQNARYDGTPDVFTVDEAKWQAFSKALTQYDPWSIPSKQPYASGVDGVQVIFEIREGDRYHRVQRWYPFDRASEKRFVGFTNAILDTLPKK